MRRRASLQILAAALGVAVLRPVFAAALGDRVVWKDVTLLDGRTLAAAALTGRVVVVEIWASWCPFCAQQNPLLQKLYDAQRGRGLDVLAFSIDREPEKARAYMRDRRYTFPAAMASPQSEQWFGPRVGLPETYVVDRDGRIVFKETQEMLPEDVRDLARFARA